MAGHQPKIVNKQFNSPINLYSTANVKEVLDRETQLLSNGAVGIDFRNPMYSKPANLQNSAVLRMLEEQEQGQRITGNGDHSNRELWPPAGGDDKRHRSFGDVVVSGVKRVAWPPPKEGEEYSEEAPVEAQGGPQYPAQSAPGFQNNHVPNQSISPNYQAAPQSPNYQPVSAGYQQKPHSPLPNLSPASFSPTVPSKPWAPVHSPVTAGTPPIFKPVQPAPQQYQPPQQQYQPPQQQYQPPQQQYQPPQQQYQPPPQQYQQPPQHYQQPPHQYQQAPQQYQQPPQQYQQPPQQYQQPLQQYQPPPQQYQQPPQQAPQQYQQPQQQYQPPQQQYQQPPQQQYQPHQQQFQPAPVSPQYQPPQQTAQAAAPSQAQYPQQQQQPQQQHNKPKVEDPPSIITLRPKAPVSQAPAPVFSSQPATATFKGGKHLRGDLKWPPPNVRALMAAEQMHLDEIAKGPANKPHKNLKDYSPFFSQHMLNCTYPGYKIPPGTQFYDHEPVM